MVRVLKAAYLAKPFSEQLSRRYCFASCSKTMHCAKLPEPKLLHVHCSASANNVHCCVQQQDSPTYKFKRNPSTTPDIRSSVYHTPPPNTHNPPSPTWQTPLTHPPPSESPSPAPTRAAGALPILILPVPSPTPPSPPGPPVPLTPPAPPPPPPASPSSPSKPTSRPPSPSPLLLLLLLRRP